MQYPVGHEETEACVINTNGVSGPGFSHHHERIHDEQARKVAKAGQEKR